MQFAGSADLANRLFIRPEMRHTLAGRQKILPRLLS
jgi:hypothetical protein